MQALQPVQLFMSMDMPHLLPVYCQLGNIVVSDSGVSWPSPSCAKLGFALKSSSVA